MSPQPRQATNHIMMVNPVVFFSNPETQGTNLYQNTAGSIAPAQLLRAARAELSEFISRLRAHDIQVTLLDGSPDCPDHIFPGNWVSTHADKTAIYYPMLAPNRRAERTKNITTFLKKTYQTLHDYAPYAAQNLFLEGTGSFALDRVKKTAYIGLSPRSHLPLAEKWAQDMRYDLIAFDTNTADQGAEETPVYHTDLLMFIGEKVASICLDCIAPKHREKVAQHLQKTHEIVPLTLPQMQEMCGNALEVIGKDDTPYLMMSTRAFQALTPAQMKIFKTHYADIIHSPIPTIENYGGGSARCLVLELF